MKVATVRIPKNHFSMSNSYRVPKTLAGERADRVLQRAIQKQVKDNPIKKTTRQEALALFEAGLVTLDGKVLSPSRRLLAGDRIEYKLPLKEKKQKKDTQENLPLVLFQNEDFIVLNKPAGIAMHGGEGIRASMYTVKDYLLESFPYLKGVGEEEERPGIVHRLDKDTSGVLLIAKTQPVYEELKAYFTERKIKKRYIALAYGSFKEATGTVNFPLERAKNSLKRVVTRKKLDDEAYKAKAAETDYRVLLQLEDAALVLLEPKTGRMHQIRVHLQALGKPILGDKLYGTKVSYLAYPLIERQMLHAISLEFSLFGTQYSFQALPPNDFIKSLKSLDGFERSGYDYEALESLFSGN